MAINKVVFGNDTLIDLTEDSVSASNLLEGETAHDRSGASVTGTAKQGHIIQNVDGIDLTQRAKLQFADADVTDDSTNQKTTVGVVRKRTQAEYDDMSAADQAKGIIHITDANAKPLFASQVRYDSSNTVKDKLDSLSTDVANKVSDNPIFTEASTRANIASGESFATILGKIKKWFTDLPNMFVSKSGGTFKGDVTVDHGNSSSTSSIESQLIAGNNIPEGTAGSAWGSLRIFGKGAFRARLMASNVTNHRDFEFPDKAGTLALTSDIDVVDGKYFSGETGFTTSIDQMCLNVMPKNIRKTYFVNVSSQITDYPSSLPYANYIFVTVTNFMSVTDITIRAGASVFAVGYKIGSGAVTISANLI